MKIGIIGAGTLGLTLARRLGREGHQVTVLESASQVGGLATWCDYGDFIWDKFYHVICRTDSSLLGLIDELGIGSKMRWTQTKTGFLWNGRQLSMSSYWEGITFPALSFLDKYRLFTGIRRCRQIEDPADLERTKAPVWLKNLFGDRVYRVIWEPLLESKYGVLKEEMPATIMWATINRYNSTRSKGREYLGFLSGGLKTFYDALTADIVRQGGIIQTSTAVESVEDALPDQIQVTTSRGGMAFDRVINTAPTAVFQRIAPRIQGFAEANATRPRFLGIICLILILRRGLSPFYVTNLIDRGFPFTGLIEVSNLAGTEELGGHHLVMLPRYDVPDSPWFDREDHAIAESFINALKQSCPDIESHLIRWQVHRERRVQALWIDGAPPAEVRPFHSPDGRIWSVNAELAGRDTLNNNAIVRVANEAARILIDCFSQQAQPAGATARAGEGRAVA